MVWARVVLAGGLLLLVAAFSLGTQPQSVVVDDQIYSCDAAIAPSWLEPGTPDQTLSPGSAATADQRRAATACGPVIHRSRVALLSAVGLGGLLALIGWTAIREQRAPAPRELVLSHD
ncbi:hypothetical protein EFL26_04235 [Nocardioides pocheonensis]|uniref:Uncharacterized protein n=1 Tax=Nocardioides pocheonensis TaxID=661485 RepID=A0A3N0GWB1_9ACTN|nr:hypothetical protein EFL26_04235 [Nocardioides pocheonensis]